MKQTVEGLGSGHEKYCRQSGRRSLFLFFAKERALNLERISAYDFVCDVAAGLEPKIHAQRIDFECNFDQTMGDFAIDAASFASR